MNNNVWFRKEKPLLSLQSMGGGASGTLMQGASDKIYIDDVYSTYLYKGTGSASTINNGIDLSGEGGMVWAKNRDAGNDHNIVDTVRGRTKYLVADTNGAEQTEAGNGSTVGRVSSFTNSGFNLGATTIDHTWNKDGDKYATWSFRKKEGFFDIVTYTGNGSGLITVNHNLGSMPGFIALKRTDGSASWICWHDYMGYSNNANYLKLDTNVAMGTDGASPPNASINSVTSTQIVVGLDENENGAEYIVYLWAGGKSTASTARSVEFDASGDYLNTTTSSSDFTMGTGDFTVEYWFKQNNSSHSGNTFQISDTSGGFKSSSFASTISAWTASDDTWKYNAGGSEKTTGIKMYKGQWYHVALVRNSGTTSLYINGTKIHSTTDNTNYNGTYIVIGGYYSTSYLLDGSLSNFRVVKGTAVYTDSFKPPTEPLTNISGTVLLCFNDSSVTGSTVTPVTLNSNGDPTASTDSPFDDPEGFKFGDESDQNLINTGAYIGNGSADGPEIHLGWEPQWVIIKNTSAAVSWHMFDSMRGIPTGASDVRLEADENGSEFSNTSDTYNYLDLTPTGFKIKTSGGWVNNDGETYIYICIRRPDGYVGKPPELGTGVFALDVAGSTSPAFDSGFPIDFAIVRNPSSSAHWDVGARLIQGQNLRTDATDVETAYSSNAFDYSSSWLDNTSYSNNQSWMWKRGQGFDVVTYEGDGASSRQIPHSLSKIPEMMWVKGRGPDVANWYVYHKAMGNGRSINLETTDQQSGVSQARWDNTTPTSTHFSIGINPNTSNNDYLAILFASVQGISKVGSFSGVASASYPLSVTTGFAPRFILIKAYSGVSGYGWFVWDSLRYSGDDNLKLALNSTAAQDSGTTYQYFNDAPISTNSTGFSIVDDGWGSTDTIEFMYYAHA